MAFSGLDPQKITNFIRLGIAVYEELTQIDRDILEKEIKSSDILEKVQKSTHFQNHKLNNKQSQTLNDAKTKGYGDFDITLLYTLIRNLCSNIQPPTNGWGTNELPGKSEISIGDDIERIRIIRNEVMAHLASAEISDQEFQRYWEEISNICNRQGNSLQKDYPVRLRSIECCVITDDRFNKFIECLQRNAENARGSRQTALKLVIKQQKKGKKKKRHLHALSKFCVETLKDMVKHIEKKSKVKDLNRIYNAIENFAESVSSAKERRRIRKILRSLSKKVRWFAGKNKRKSMRILAKFFAFQINLKVMYNVNVVWKHGSIRVYLAFQTFNDMAKFAIHQSDGTMEHQIHDLLYFPDLLSLFQLRSNDFLVKLRSIKKERINEKKTSDKDEEDTETEVSAIFRQYFENLERNKTERFSYDNEKIVNSLKEVFIGINEVVSSPEFGEDLREILSRTFENYLIELKEREDDLFKRDCAIMVVGDTSTGKSTLINLLFNEKILDTGLFACTKKIYKLIGSDSIQVKTYSAEKTVLKEYQNITSLEELKLVLREIETNDLDKVTTSESSDSSSDDTDSIDSDSNDNDVDKTSTTDTTLTVGPSGTNEGEVYIPKYTQESYQTSKYRSYQESAQESVFHEESPNLDFPGDGSKFTPTLSYSDTCASDFLETSFRESEGGYKSELTKEWKRMLKESTEEAPDKDSKRNTDRQICREVEIYFPSTKLKGNIMIVDSPGFGESEELDQRLRDYIRSAVSFIFVTDVNRGGGLQKEGISRILHEIEHCQVSMFSFDPSDVIFVSNKWDTVDEKDRKRIKSDKKETKRRIKKAWPGIKKGHICFLSAKKVDHSKNDKFLKEYKKFEKVLLEVLEANENKRAKTNFSFLDDFFRHIVRIIRPRYDGLFQNEEKTHTLLKETRLRLEKLEKFSTKTEKKHDLRIQGYVEDLANKVLSFFQEKEFKEKILSEKKMKWSTMPKKEISSEVTKRIEHETRHIIETEANKFLENDIGGILADYDNIMGEIYETDTQLSGLKISYRMERTIPFSVFKFDTYELRSVALLSVLTGMRFGPSVGISIAAGCLFIFAYKHLTEVWQLKGPNVEIAREVFTKINSGTDVSKIKEMLDKSFGNWCREIISRLFNCIIPGEINSIRLSIEGMENNISILKSKRHQLQDLKSKLDELEGKINACSKTILTCKTE